MTTYDNRRRIELVHGTAAVRAGLVLAAHELWVDVDGSGVPTGDIWLGDGVTLAGLGPISSGGGGVTDHGGLSGLGDDDHPQYARLASSPTFTGAVTAAGLLSTGLSNQIVNALPILALYNVQHEDTDGGRVSQLIAVGERSGGEIHYLGILRFDHEGAGDDEQGRLIARLNSGAEGVAPSVDVMTLTGSDALALFAGEVRTPFGRIACMQSSSTRQSFVGGAGASVVALSSLDVDSGYTWDDANDELLCSFDGRVLASYSGAVERVAEVRGSIMFWIERDSGSGFAEITGTRRSAYFRQSTDASTGALTPYPLTVADGEKFRVRAEVMEASPASCEIQPRGFNLTFQRIQGSS